MCYRLFNVYIQRLYVTLFKYFLFIAYCMNDLFSLLIVDKRTFLLATTVSPLSGEIFKLNATDILEIYILLKF